MDGQKVLDLEPLRGLLHALALQEVLGLDPLLGQVDVDGIAHGYPEAPGRAQALDQFLYRGLDHALADAAEERKEDDIDLAR